MKKVRVLQLIGELNPAGAERLAVGLARRISSHVEASYICSRAGGELLKECDPGRTFIEKKRFVIDFSHLYRLCSIIAKYDIDIVHSHMFGNNLYGYFAALATGRKIIFTIHGEESFKNKRRIFFYKFASRRVSKIVAVSLPIYKKLVDDLSIMPSKVILIINGVEFSKGVEPTAKKNELGIPHNSPVVVSVGNIKPVKGYDILIKAAEDVIKKIPNVSFLIAGAVYRNGQHMGELKEMIRRKNLYGQVVFLGKRDDVDEILQISDVYVLPSRSEGTSLSLLEAMAAGKPIVATKVGGTPHIIQDRRNGILVPSEDTLELSRGIIALLSDRRFARELGKNAREDFEKNYTIESMVQRYIHLYNTI